MSRNTRFLQLVVAAFVAVCALRAQTPVVTRSGDNSRSGDFQETTMTVASLKAKGITRRTTIPVIGDRQGMEAQPLILPGVKVADGTTHDVLVLPSMANVVRGVDAHTGAGIWQTTLGVPVQGGSSIDMHLINDKWGVLSTGVIDPATRRAYMVAWISPDGTPVNGVHWIYTLNIATGAIAQKPVSLAGIANSGQGYSDTMRKQRSSLVMTTVNGRKTIFFAYGTVLETGRAAAGAIVAYDIASNKISGFLPMSLGLGAGIWMGGQGLAADSKGNLYGVTGNGSFNGVNDFGESMFKVSYTFGSDYTKTLKVASWFSPYSDHGRIGLDPTDSGPAAPVSPAKLAGASQPTEDMTPVGGAMAISLSGATAKVTADVNTGAMVTLVYPANANDAAWNDEDLGSGGCTLVEKYGVMLCSGKDGIGYVVKTANLGNTMPADFANAKANCAKLAAPPVWLTASPGPVDPCPQDTTVLNFMPGGKTRHMHATPVQYWAPDGTLHLFIAGENSTIHKWAMSTTGTLTYEGESYEIASADSTQPPGGMPGSFCSISTNNWAAGTSILWCSIPYGNANAEQTTGRLIAYDPENLTQDRHLQKLWDSRDWGITYQFNKFMPPTIWMGELLLPNYNGGVDLYTQ